MSDSVDNASIPQSEGTQNLNITNDELSKLIEPSVNKISENLTDPKTLTNLENHSIINQKENQIVSLKESPQSQKQNQPAPTNLKEKSPTQTKPQYILQTNQSQKNAKNTDQIVDPNNSTEAQTPKNDQAKIQPPSQINKTQNESKKDIQSKAQPNKTSSPYPKSEGPQAKVESAQKIQQAPLRNNSNEVPNPKKQEEKSLKELPSTKDRKIEEPVNQQKLPQKPSQKLIPENNSTDNQKQRQKQKQTTKELQKESQKELLPKSAESKVIDSHDANSTKLLSESKKNESQVEKESEKQIQRKENEPSKKLEQKPEIPQQSEGFSFNQLLKILLQKCRQREEKAKNKGETKTKVLQDDSLDLNLSLDSSQPANQSSQSRIKLEIKLIQQTNQKKNQTVQIGQATEHVENQLSNSEQNEPKTQSPDIKQKIPDIKVAFYLYNLKNPHNKEATEIQKNKTEDKQNLQKKLQQVTNSYDKNLFSFKVSLKDEVPPQKNKLPFKTVKFNFDPSLISSELGIKPQRLQSLKKILTTNQEQKTDNGLNPANEDETKKSIELKEQDESSLNVAKNPFYFITSAEFQLFSSFKNLETTKFLSLVSNGFKIRLQSRRQNNKKSSHPHFFEKVFRQAIIALAPSLLTQYLVSISSGSANIKFKSIQNLTKLLQRLGINEIFEETPSIKEVLKQLVQIYFRSLFLAKTKSQSTSKKSEKQVKGRDQNQTKQKLSFLWKVIETVFHEANCHGLAIELILYQMISVKLTLQCHSSHINKLWDSINE